MLVFDGVEVLFVLGVWICRSVAYVYIILLERQKIRALGKNIEMTIDSLIDRLIECLISESRYVTGDFLCPGSLSERFAA